MNKNQLKESYGTLSETINGLIDSGYTHDFNIQEECIVCLQTNTILSPENFSIDKVYRFEGASDPDYQSVLYAISSKKFNMKGFLVDGYGISSDIISSRLMEKLQTHAPESDSTPIHQEEKHNEATPLRPEGDRLINAELVEMDLNKSIEQLKSESTWKDSDRNSVTIFKSDTLRLVIIGLKEDADLKPHKANGVISVQVLEGKVSFITDDQAIVLETGQMVALDANVTHNVVGLEDSFFLLTLSMNQ